MDNQQTEYDYDSPPLPDPLDRRQGSRSAAAWMSQKLETQSKLIQQANTEVIVEVHEVRNEVLKLEKETGEKLMHLEKETGEKLNHIEKKVDELGHTLTQFYDGPPPAHRHEHEDTARRNKAEDEAAANWKKIMWSVIGIVVTGIVGLIGVVMSYGVAEMFRGKVTEVQEGKTAADLRHFK